MKVVLLLSTDQRVERRVEDRLRDPRVRPDRRQVDQRAKRQVSDRTRRISAEETRRGTAIVSLLALTNIDREEIHRPTWKSTRRSSSHPKCFLPVGDFLCSRRVPSVRWREKSFPLCFVERERRWSTDREASKQLSYNETILSRRTFLFSLRARRTV